MIKYSLIFLLIPTICFGMGPFLVCDPQIGVDTYNVYVDDALLYEDVPAFEDGSLRMDLSIIDSGKYKFEAVACNEWGCSDKSNPYVSADKVRSPTSLGIKR